MMHPEDVKPGQRVQVAWPIPAPEGFFYLPDAQPFEDREFIVLDRAPGRDNWWLQEPETGRIGTDLQAYAFQMRLVSDEYRKALIVGLNQGAVSRVARRHTATWALVRAHKTRWNILHLGPEQRAVLPERLETGYKPVNQLFNRLAKEVSDGVPALSPEQHARALAIVKAWSEEHPPVERVGRSR